MMRAPQRGGDLPVATNICSTADRANCQLFMIGLPSKVFGNDRRRCRTASLACRVHRNPSHVRHQRLQELICARPELDDRCYPQCGGAMVAYSFCKLRPERHRPHEAGGRHRIRQRRRDAQPKKRRVDPRDRLALASDEPQAGKIPESVRQVRDQVARMPAALPGHHEEFAIRQRCRRALAPPPPRAEAGPRTHRMTRRSILPQGTPSRELVPASLREPLGGARPG